MNLDDYKVMLYRNQPDGWVAEVPAGARAEEFRLAGRWIHPDGRRLAIPNHWERGIGRPIFHRIREQLRIGADEFRTVQYALAEPLLHGSNLPERLGAVSSAKKL